MTRPGARWTLTGSNTIATAKDNGSLSLAAGATLQVTVAVDPASSGVFQLNNTSILEVLADKGTTNQMKFLGTGELIVDQAASFGIHVGKATYQGPLIENFGAGDMIDLKDVLLAGSALSYSAASGLLQITQGSTGVATLAFQDSSPGGDGFHLNDDGTGQILLTHS